MNWTSQAIDDVSPERTTATSDHHIMLYVVLVFCLISMWRLTALSNYCRNRHRLVSLYQSALANPRRPNSIRDDVATKAAIAIPLTEQTPLLRSCQEKKKMEGEGEEEHQCSLYPSLDDIPLVDISRQQQDHNTNGGNAQSVSQSGSIDWTQLTTCVIEQRELASMESQAPDRRWLNVYTYGPGILAYYYWLNLLIYVFIALYAWKEQFSTTGAVLATMLCCVSLVLSPLFGNSAI